MRSEIQNSIVILLLLIFAACTPRETVTVSGAVNRPGDVGYRSDWKLENYVAAAGGFLAEADTGRAVLVRDAGDSVVAGAHGNVLKWAVEDAPAPLPGDLITVPLKSYRVRFDTVMAVGDLRLEWRDHVYLMAHGRAALGTTPRGVVAAVFFGNGEVIRQASGNAAGPFQYLYVTMHPDRYGGLLPATALPSLRPRVARRRGGAAPLYVPDVHVQGGRAYAPAARRSLPGAGRRLAHAEECGVSR